MIPNPLSNTRDESADEREPVLPEPEPGINPEGEPDTDTHPPDAEKPPRRREGVVSNPDF